MKKKILAVTLSLGCLFTIPAVSYAEEDYSYLEDMSIKELKALDVAIHELLGDVSNNETPQIVESHTDVILTSTAEGDIAEIDFETPITIIDNEDITLVATGKYFQYDKRDSTLPYETGYKIELNNHSKYYVSLAMLSISIDGYALSRKFFTSFDEVGPNTKAKGDLCANLHSYTKDDYGYEFNSIDDLHDTNGSIQIHRSEESGTFSSNMSVNVEFLSILP